MAMGMGGLGDTSWVDQQMAQMRGGGMGLGGGLQQSLNQVPGLDSGSAKNWVEQQMGSMRGAGGANGLGGLGGTSINQVAGLDAGSAKNWVDQQIGGGSSLGGGLGGLGGGSLLGGLGDNFGAVDPLQAAAEQQRNLQMAQMMGSAGLAPGGGLGAVSPFGGLV